MGTLLYYACAVDLTLIFALITLVSRNSSAATATMMSGVNHFLDYCSTYHKANIWYYALDMQLKIHSDGSYLSKPNVKSRIGRYSNPGNKKNSNLPHSPMALSCAIQQYSNMWFPP
jgi:hypothetical protein